ncbi:MAG: hypothetical protein ACI9YG_002103, partial [Candidatus Azotimanducaceae bacterium]
TVFSHRLEHVREQTHNSHPHTYVPVLTNTSLLLRLSHLHSAASAPRLYRGRAKRDGDQ